MPVTAETPVSPAGNTAATPTPPAEVAGDATAARAGTRARRWAGHAGDASALALLLAVLWYLEGHDGGGQGLGPLRDVGVVALLALPVAWREAARLPRWGAGLLAAWGGGALASVAFAVVRSDLQRPVLVLALTPIVFLVTRRLWRRPWGPAALLAVLAVTLGMYWHRSFLQWWGATLQGQAPTWRALSWHNQSGILMAALAVGFLGVALRTDRVVRLAAVLLAAGAAAGTWLSGSRGALLALVATVALLAVAAVWRAPRDRRILVPVATVAAGVVLATLVGAGLLRMDQRADATTPLEARDQSVEQNTGARLRHWQGALGMFVERPLTGTGIGSYRVSATAHTPPDANLTSSAHNQYVENLGEGGLVLGVPFLLAMAALGVAALRRLFGAPGDAVEDGAGPDAAGEVVRGEVATSLAALRGPVAAGGAAAALAIAAHSAIDFDWRYLVLPGLLAIGAAVAWPADRRPARPWRGAALLPVAVLLVGGLMLTQATIRPVDGAGSDRVTAAQYAASVHPWDLDRSVQAGYRLLEDGESELARHVTRRALRWSPGASRLRTVDRLIDFHEGAIAAGELAGSVRPPVARFDEYVVVARALVDAGEYDLAGQLLTEQAAQVDRYRAWGVAGAEQDAALARLYLTAARDGCDAATRLVDELTVAQLLPAGVPTAELLGAAGTSCGTA